MVNDEWPLVGRAAERELLLGNVAARRGTVVVGAVGVGKTRLVHDVARALHPHCAVEAVAATHAGSSVPLGAFAHLDDGNAHGFVTPIGALRHGLLRRAADRPLVLVVDDAHALDVA
ncbi:MAG: LuxR family transcriptional regulator, partial [Acidimicrobiia bacterium]